MIWEEDELVWLPNPSSASRTHIRHHREVLRIFGHLFKTTPDEDIAHGYTDSNCGKCQVNALRDSVLNMPVRLDWTHIREVSTLCRKTSVLFRIKCLF
jgi:hypothetical protein